ncbi:MAG TPA: autotransporter-associated beta strand repeat-containing protein [Fimbriimonadaceae bacterium]|nr:autotransporter-associated beta strand repeat-containing protein [Fimbriimonadaceae bacterium]
MNRLDLSSDSIYPTYVNLGSPYWIGANPTISVSGSGDFQVSGDQFALAGNLDIVGHGDNVLSVGSRWPIPSTRTVFIDLDSGQTLRGIANGTFAGPVVLNSGILKDYIPGSGPLIVNGGRVAFRAQVASDIILNADLIGQCSMGARFKISANNSWAGWHKASGNFSGLALYEGPTETDGTTDPADLFFYDGAAIPRSGSFLFRNSNVTVVEASRPVPTMSFNPEAPVELDGAYFRIFPASEGSTEPIGDVSLRQWDEFYVLGDPWAPCNLHLKSLRSDDDGALTVMMSQQAGGTNITVDQSPEVVGGHGGALSPNMDILPFAYGGRSFLTYQAGELRPLDPTNEFAATLKGDPTNNVRLDSATSSNDPEIVNSLLVAPSGAILGSGSVQITSGLVANQGAGGIQNDLDFGNRRGRRFCDVALTISGRLHGRDGLNHASGTLTLSGDNSDLTGELDVNGTLEFTADASLPGTGTIVGGNGSLWPMTQAPYVLSRDLLVRGKQFALGYPSGSPIDMTSRILGPGGLQIGGDVRLSSANSYEGDTTISNGTLRISDDAALGASRTITVQNANLMLEGDWSTDRNLVFTSATLDTGSSQCLFSGPFSGNLTKIGSGTLTLAHSSNALVDVNGGIANVQAPLMSVIVNSGGTLCGVGPTEGATLKSGGSLSPGVAGAGTFACGRLDWFGGGVIDLDLGQVSDAIRFSSDMVNGGGSGPHAFRFHPGANFGPGTYVLATFHSTNFAAGDLSYTGLPSGFAGRFVVEPNRLLFVVASAHSH